MGKFLLLAFRNVFRNRRRTVMTLLMVGGGVAGLLLAGGYFAFMIRGLRESTIRNGLGHLQIFTAEHFQRDEVHVLDTGIENWRRVANCRFRAACARRRAPHRVLRHGVEWRQSRRSSWAAPSIPMPSAAWDSQPEVASGRDSRTQRQRRRRGADRRRPRQIDERQSGRRAHAFSP